MATCADCVHVEACSRKQKIVIDGLNRAAQYAEKFTNEKIEVGCSKEESLCELFCDRSRFVELPQPVKPGDKLWYILDGLGAIDLQQYKTTRGSSAVGDVPDIVFDVSTRGFWIAGVRRKDTEPISFDDCFFVSWDELGKTYFLSREAAEEMLKERGSNEGEDTGVSDSGSKESSRGRAAQ